MKKIIILFAALFSLNQIDAYANVKSDSKSDEIYIYEMVNGSGDSFRSRSIGPVVEACIDYDMGQIEIAINTYIGVATITLVDSMGAALSTINCDTETEWGAYLPIPACAGAYTLKIDSPVAEFTGSFIVD